jgi:hypothetical protein
MIRSPNPVDFWRGFALLTIFINHIPGIYFDSFTHRNFAMSDSADLFVFLAGWGLRLMIIKLAVDTPISQLMFNLGGRAVRLYAAQMMMVTIAIATLSFAASSLSNPLILEWNNAASVFYNPAETHIGIAILSHQLGYFDILPLYVTLMLIAPFIVYTKLKAPSILLPASCLIYVTALLTRVNLPTWPNQGEWFFNPLCWQFVFVLGFVLAGDSWPARFVRKHIILLRFVSLPLLVIGAWVIITGWWPDLDTVPEPKLFFLFSKTFATPPRLVQFLALVAVGSAVFPYFLAWTPRLVAFFTLLGRNSLHVFCVGSLLSLWAQVIRFAFPESLILDTAIVMVGFLTLALVGWVSEWRDRAGR